MHPRRPVLVATSATAAVLAAAALVACKEASAHRRASGPARSTTAPASLSPSPSGTVARRHVSPSPTAPSSRPVSRPAHTSRKPHRDSGLPPVLSRLPTRDRVVFITIDDGWEKEPDFVELVRRQHVPLTLFLTDLAIRKNYEYFRELQRAGALIENHTLTHPYLPKLSYARQRHEICGAGDTYARVYGARPTLLRAPYGAANRTTLRAARDCGIKALFFWREVVGGGRIEYQVPGRLHRGDILLVHFDPGMTRNFRALLRAIRRQGFSPAAVRDYLPPRLR